MAQPPWAGTRRGQDREPHLPTPSPKCPPAQAHLVMSGSVTRWPACKAALKQCAPWVSMATMGTCCQPTSTRPAATPARSPPPPTDSTTAPGGVRSAAFSSRTRLAWPSLRRGREEKVRGPNPKGSLGREGAPPPPIAITPFMGAPPSHSRGGGASKARVPSFLHSPFVPSFTLSICLPGPLSDIVSLSSPGTLERGSVSGCDKGGPTNVVLELVSLLLPSCVILVKCPDPSEPWFFSPAKWV
jgi:hypothetical protein